MARSATTTDPAQRMDRMYRYTRHIYDWTRRPYLLGRDRVLQDIAARPAGHVLEIGCGTARNLRVLHEQAPHHTLYGLDASKAMLDTAQATASPEVRHAMCLKQGLAQSVEPRMFGRVAPFDVVLCSYVLSMIPDAPAAVDAALNVLSPGGRLYLVDFWDQADWPAPSRWALQRWLSWFDVHHRPDLHAHLDDLAARTRIRLTRTPVAHRYAYQAVAVKEVS